MENKAYNGKYVTVTEEDIGGSTYERVYIHNSLTVFPVTEDGRILFIQERRLHERPNIRWKPVTGYVECDGTIEDNVNRELQEEIGLKAGSLEPFFEMRLTGTINTIQRFFIARDLSSSKIPNPDGEDTILDVAPLGLEEILQRTLDGEFAKGSVGYALMRLYYMVKNGDISL